MAVCTFSPLVIGIGHTTLIMFRREIESINQMIGLVLSTIINQLLKRYFCEARPTNSVKTGHGMPSDHSQFMAFFTIYVLAWLWTRANHSINQPSRILLSLCLPLLTVLVAISRIHLEVHTIGQVCAGLVIGTILGALYFAFSFQFLYQSFYPWFLRTRLAVYWSLKDMSIVPEVMQWEREAWMAYQKWLDQQTFTNTIHQTNDHPSFKQSISQSIHDVHNPPNHVASQAADAILQHHSHHQAVSRKRK